MSFHTPEHTGGGEAAVEALIQETTEYNAFRRSTSYRLQSMPGIVISLPGDAPQVVGHLFEAQDRLAADLAAILPSVVMQSPEPPYFGD